MTANLKRSALLPLHLAANAMLGDHHGWLVPDRFADPQAELAAVREQVGLADVSYRIKYLLPARPEGASWHLTDERFLVIGDPPCAVPARAIDVTSVYAVLLLAGPLARKVLAKLGAADLSDRALPDRRALECDLAHVHCIVLRTDTAGVPGYQLLAPRDYALGLWEAVAHAGVEFHLAPFGQETLAALEQR